MSEIGWNGDKKTIPSRYLRSSRSQRLELLAGLMDKNGCLIHSCFEFSTKDDKIADSVTWLARSLGFQATLRTKVSTIKEIGFSGVYYRVFISGNTSEIPTRIERKKASPRRQVKSVGHFGMKATPIGHGEYFGFEVDGDHRFLLGDFTVTHNSTFAAGAPKPIFIGTDDGCATLDVASFPIPKTWLELNAQIDALQNEKHDYETAVLDTINGFEPLLWAHICLEHKCGSIEDVDGGWGKGYVRAYEYWVEFWKKLKILRKKMHVIALGHAKEKTIVDILEGERFDRYLIKMNDEAAKLFHESVDSMFFANFVTDFRKEKGAKKARAFGDGKRVIYTQERPWFMAKSRFDLPFEMDLSWDAFFAAAKVQKTRSTNDELAAIFDGIEDQANAYLIEKDWIKEGQTWRDLMESRRKPIINRADDFRNAVKNFATEREEQSNPQPE